MVQRATSKIKTAETITGARECATPILRSGNNSQTNGGKHCATPVLKMVKLVLSHPFMVVGSADH